MKDYKRFKPVTDKHISNFLRLKLARRVIDTFREQNPKIVALWKEFDSAAVSAIKNPEEKFYVAGERIYFAVTNRVGYNAMCMVLPSGHTLIYPEPRLKRAIKRHVDDEGNVREWETNEISFHGQVQGSAHWSRVGTFGARLVENACQAIGGDFLSHGLVVAEKRGYETFMIVHDEALDTEGEGKTPEGYAEALCDLPDWAKDFPLDSDGGIVPYYTKD